MSWVSLYTKLNRFPKKWGWRNNKEVEGIIRKKRKREVQRVKKQVKNIDSINNVVWRYVAGATSKQDRWIRNQTEKEWFLENFVNYKRKFENDEKCFPNFIWEVFKEYTKFNINNCNNVDMSDSFNSICYWIWENVNNYEFNY